MDTSAIIETQHVNLRYGDTPALKDVSIRFPEQTITALIGPSGCGKSTLLRCFNRMNDLIPSCRIEGGITYHGTDIYAPCVDPVQLRKRVGMVFQRPNPFPKSIFDNITYGPRMHGIRDRKTLEQIVEESLKKAALWDEERMVSQWKAATD